MKKRFRRLVCIFLVLMLLPLGGCSNDETAADTLDSVNNSLNGGYVVETPKGNYFLSCANEERANILYKIEDDQISPAFTLRDDYRIYRPCMSYYDGKVILYLCNSLNSIVYPGVILSVDLESGEQEVLVEAPVRQIYITGNKMFYLSGVATDVDKSYSNSPVLKVYDLDTAEDKVIMQANCGDAGFFFFPLNDRIYFAYGEEGASSASKIRSVFDMDGNEIEDDPIVKALSDCYVSSVQVDAEAIYFTEGGASSDASVFYTKLYRLSLDDFSISEIYGSDQYMFNSYCLMDDYIILLRRNAQSASDQLVRMTKTGDDLYIYTKRPESISYGNFGMTSLQPTSSNVYLYERSDTSLPEGTEDVYLEWISLEDMGVLFEGQVNYFN